MNSSFFYGKGNSEADSNQSSSESNIDYSEPDISCDESSDVYEPSSFGSEYTDGSSSPCSEDSSDEEMDAGAQSTECTTWGHCTLLPPRFGFVGAEEPQVNIAESDPYAIYKHFLTDEILRLVVDETNRYAHQFISTHQLRQRSLMRKWKDTTAKEIEKFFGIIMIMGIVQLPQLRLYWSKNLMYRNELIVRLMTRNRFELLLKCLHFCNNDDIADDTEKLFKVEKVTNLAITQFIQAVDPGKDVVIDETMIPWRGRLSFRQYIPGKAHKYGVKLYKLCTVEGYTWNLKVYCGKEARDRRPTGKLHSENVVMTLMKDLLLSGRELYVDNFYTSLSLTEALLAKQVFLCGTLRQKRKGNPQEVCNKKLKKGEVIGVENEHGIRVIKWMDKRSVLMMTSKPEHFDVLVSTGRKNRLNEDVEKPLAVINYNHAKKGVDISDQMSSYYTCVRKTIKWYKKVFFEILLGAAVVNAWYVHCRITGKKMQMLRFREALIAGMITENTDEEDNLPTTSGASKSAAGKTSKQKHQLARYEGTARASRKRCTACYRKVQKNEGAEVARKKAKRVMTYCKECEGMPALCLDCFNEKHS